MSGGKFVRPEGPTVWPIRDFFVLSDSTILDADFSTIVVQETNILGRGYIIPRRVVPAGCSSRDYAYGVTDFCPAVVNDETSTHPTRLNETDRKGKLRDLVYCKTAFGPVSKCTETEAMRS
jgi:hypothetical protein